MTPVLKEYFDSLKLPAPQSHKGQNGKLLIIGGSELFHAASKWSLDVASKFVDMVFYASVPSNNELVHAAKGEFWNGIVVPRTEIENYLEEADAVLIGPGMDRNSPQNTDFDTPPTPTEWNENTHKIVNYLLKKYPHKKWVVDAGALQMVDSRLLTSSVIITPHHQELQRLVAHYERLTSESNLSEAEVVKKLLELGSTILLKGPVDFIYRGDEVVEVTGGNPGMTKGGTGDVLAGLVAALYTKNDAMTAAVVGSYVNKRAGESLAEQLGPFFNASDLVEAVPKVLWEAYKKNV